MAKVLIVAGLVALAFAVYAVVDCALTERARVRGLPRWAWVIVILALPLVGGALWFLIGDGRRQQPGPTRRVVGPDDDPEFLRSRKAAPAPPVVDEAEWHRLEQELAAVESEADGDDEADPRRR